MPAQTYPLTRDHLPCIAALCEHLTARLHQIKLTPNPPTVECDVLIAFLETVPHVISSQLNNRRNFPATYGNN
jgi:hypothetical protein